jgi:thiol-disulfide isomerase/thioredoxin
MKVFLKNIALFIVLTLAFSALTSCTGTNTASVNNNSAAPSNSTNAAPDKPKINYPPAPSAIMQADIKNLDGTTFKLQDKKGKVLLVNLWGIWCGPCIAEMPELIKMQENYKEKGFEVIGLNVGDEDGAEESKENIDKFAEKMKLNYPLAYASEPLTNEFFKVTRLGGVPQSLLINRDGQLTGMFVGGGPKTVKDMKETVEKIVNQ